MAGRDLEAQGKHFETFVKKKARWFEEVAKESTLSCVDSRSGADGASPGYTAARQVRQLRDDAAYQNPQPARRFKCENARSRKRQVDTSASVTETMCSSSDLVVPARPQRRLE